MYVGAFVPDQGESILTSYDAATYPGSLLGPTTTEVRPAPNPAAKGGQDLDIYIQAAHFREVFAGDQPTAKALTMAATQRPLSLTANNEPSGAPAWKTIPSWDLITLNDKAISPGGQAFMARARTRTRLHRALRARRDGLAPPCRRAHDPGCRQAGALRTAQGARLWPGPSTGPQPASCVAR